MKNTLLFLFLLLLGTETFAQSKAIHTEVTGDGTPILFLPGFACPGDVWKSTAGRIGDGYEKHFLTYAGFVGTTPAKGPWYETIKVGIVAYIKENNLKNTILIAHSMGGNLAIDIARELPDRINKMVLADALPCLREVMMPNMPAESISYKNPYNDRLMAMDSVAFANNARMMAQQMTMSPEKKKLIATWMQQVDRKTFVYGYTDLLKLDQKEQLADVKAKSLLLFAPVPDVARVKETIAKQYAKLSRKQVFIASGSLHFIMFDQEDWLVEKINEFLGHGQ
ncbi:hypothetical protein FUAX_06860 [Fulvitalea axinellae]|uniref:AB hydrolase-1 domain-containing protein n=1 Tax=Fulvitalea axinellae TaxID=1182444 RepID=A0AAU9D1E3_9BACT|nr:hypothetical protein FUAX_06860 [Fulvitalea axinellae]